MDINSIALIILTAFINLAVTNYIFYRYQKKIEETFAKSMLEYQTKFVRNYEKTDEVLGYMSTIIEQHNAVLEEILLTSDFESKNITEIRLVFWEAYEEMNLKSERLEKIYQSLAQANQ